MSDGSEIYEVYEDGRSEYFMTVQGYSPELMQFQGNLMFLDGVDYPYPLIYDLEKKEYVPFGKSTRFSVPSDRITSSLWSPVYLRCSLS